MAMLALGKAFQSPPGLGLAVPSSLSSWFSIHIRAVWGIAACTLPTLAYEGANVMMWTELLLL